MIISVHQPQYIPYLGYFDKIAKSDAFVFLDQVQYKPREFQNRNKIRTKDSWIWLSVPVVSKGLGRQPISEVIIDNNFPWQRKHLTSLKTCYGASASFNEYLLFFEEVYVKKWQRLLDLNVHIINYMLGQLSVARPIYLESQLGIKGVRTKRIIEICKKLKADTYLSGIGGKDYLDEQEFIKAGTRLVYQNFTHPAYRQQFMVDKSDFIPYMSILDLLFNEGPKARQILGIGGKK